MVAEVPEDEWQETGQQELRDEDVAERRRIGVEGRDDLGAEEPERVRVELVDSGKHCECDDRQHRPALEPAAKPRAAHALGKECDHELTSGARTASPSSAAA